MTDDHGLEYSTRQLMHGWITTQPTITETVPWSQGTHAIPGVASSLGGSQCNISRETYPTRITEIKRDTLEITARFDLRETEAVGLRLRVSEDRREYIGAYYGPASDSFGIDGPTILRNQKELTS